MNDTAKPTGLADRDVLQHELEMLRQEKLRRSRQQFEYVRLSLINVGVLSFFGIFSVLGQDEDMFARIVENSTFVFALMCVLTVLSVTLFLFWVDDALSIAGIDRFLYQKEKQVDNTGDAYWYEYREQLNRTGAFRAKKWIFNAGVLLSFVSPPFLFLIFAALHTALQIPTYVQIGGAVMFFLMLVTPLVLWRKFSKRLYG
ncbi:MAG: hypothetical protein AAF004_03430 [Pseudomonadota bacterium]